MTLKSTLRNFRQAVIRSLRKYVPANLKHLVRNKLVLERLYTEKAYKDRQRQHAALLASKEIINVAFQVVNLGCWKGDSVLRLMQAHPRFRPMIWLIPERNQPAEKQRKNQEACRTYFTAKGVDCLDCYSLADFPEGAEPDIIFPPKPYTHNIFSPHNKALFKKLVCYIPYCFQNTDLEIEYNCPIQNIALYTFSESGLMADLIGPMMRNKGRNVLVTGHPTADQFLFPDEYPQVWRKQPQPCKRVIWAPHWSIFKNYLECYEASTFLLMAEPMLRLAEKYRGCIQFAFKPHPTLYPMLCQHPDWGKERTDAYYRKWEEMPNTQYEDGTYTALFLQSDAIIHDCGSFILEYLYTGKPCMYLMEGNGYPRLNQMTRAALACYEIGRSPEDAEQFLELLLAGESNPDLQARREQFRNTQLLPPGGKSAAQNIIDALLTPQVKES